MNKKSNRQSNKFRFKKDDCKYIPENKEIETWFCNEKNQAIDIVEVLHKQIIQLNSAEHFLKNCSMSNEHKRLWYLNFLSQYENMQLRRTRRIGRFIEEKRM